MLGQIRVAGVFMGQFIFLEPRWTPGIRCGALSTLRSVSSAGLLSESALRLAPWSSATVVLCSFSEHVCFLGSFYLFRFWGQPLK